MCEFDFPDTGVVSFLNQQPGKDSEEYLRFEPGGNIYVHGKLIEHDHEVYMAIASWLHNQKCTQCNKAILQPKKCSFCKGTGLDDHQNKANSYNLTHTCRQCNGAGNVRRF